MRRMLAVALIAGAAWAAVAAADGGGPSPGPTWGQGKVDRTAGLRYVALLAGSTSVVESIRIADGSVFRWTTLRGMFGLPMVAWDGSLGGLSSDGRNLVLATPAGPSWTRFLLLDSSSLAIRARARLRGNFAFDALSPDGSLMYLLQYLGSPNLVNRPYAVRAFNWDTGKLYPGAIVDRREPDEKMTGQPVTRTGTPSGWAYTLYQRGARPPFVHALDTVHRRAFCVDVPWRNSSNWIASVRMRVRGGELLLRRGGKVIARMDRKTLAMST